MIAYPFFRLVCQTYSRTISSQMCYLFTYRSSETRNTILRSNVDVTTKVKEPPVPTKNVPLPYTPVTAEISLKDQPLVNKEEVSIRFQNTYKELLNEMDNFEIIA